MTRSLSTFMALESNGSLLAYDPLRSPGSPEIDVLPVADSDKWLKPAAIGGYFGNLYVLDEPTTSLDVTTEAVILEKFVSMLYGCPRAIVREVRLNEAGTRAFAEFTVRRGLF